MMRWIYGFIVCLFCFQDIHAKDECHLGSRAGDPAAIVENVSTIHGDYTEIEVDVTVNAPDTLIFSRFYSSRDSMGIATLGGWRFNPHCFLDVEEDSERQALIHVGNPDGSILTYEKCENSNDLGKRLLFKVDAERSLGLANTAKGNIGAWTNSKNNELYYDSETDSFELSLCTLGKRFYAKHSAQGKYLITHETLPSGNKIFYKFDDQDRLELIKETNSAEQKVLGWISISYQDGMHIETSDGKNVDYAFEKDPSGLLVLSQVSYSHKPNLLYAYHTEGDRALLTRKTLPEDRYVHIDYYLDSVTPYKVKTITTPIDDQRTSILEFIYEEGATEVRGPGSSKAIYRYNAHLQLTAIEHYLDGSLYRIHQKLWGKANNAANLMATSIADGAGHIFYHKCFVYDKENKGNIVEEREYGDVAGIGSIVLEVDEEGRVSNQKGHSAHYTNRE